MGLFGPSRKEREMQADAQRRRAAEEADQDRRLRANIEAQNRMSTDRDRFNDEWKVWLHNIDEAQKSGNRERLTSDILQVTGDVPLPKSEGINVVILSQYRSYITAFTGSMISSMVNEASAAGGNRREYWKSVQQYVNENLRFV